MLTRADIDRYDRDGFIVIPGVMSKEEVAGLRDATDDLVFKSRDVASHNDVYDLEPGHTAEKPKVRRIKTPDRWDPLYLDGKNSSASGGQRRCRRTTAN